nr:hypothetical protein [Tanacetum cinerariifolium]
DEEDEEEEEEHLAPADSAVVIPTDELVSPPEGIEPIIPPPSTDTATTKAKITERLARYMAPVALPSPPLPPPLHMPLPVDRKDDIPETEMPPRNRLCLSSLGSRDTWIDPAETIPEIAPMTVGENSHIPMSRYGLAADRLTYGSHSSHEDNRRNVQTARPYFYADFMKCHPLNFKGTEGVVSLTRWVEKMESVFQISGCAVENQVKFATCTLLDAALTWWNSQIRSLGPDAYSMTWKLLKKKMTDKYCPEGEIKKLEIELPDNIFGSVKASKPKTLVEPIELTNDLMDQKLRTYAERQSNNKRKADESFRNNHGHQQQTPKRQNVARKCHKCNKVGHFAHDCKSSGNINVANAHRNNGANPKGNGCFECGATRHFKRDCPKLKNKDGEKVNAPG